MPSTKPTRRRTRRRPTKPAPARSFDERPKAEAAARSLSAPIIYADHSGPNGARRWKIEAATGLKSRSRARGWLRADGKVV
ncbi:MAG: hypothetical protein OXN81_21790 [Alphaproteobacteria bacterium]|nr:hypothetical protein [Alphaproteobacteria bacterium]